MSAGVPYAFLCLRWEEKTISCATLGWKCDTEDVANHSFALFTKKPLRILSEASATEISGFHRKEVEVQSPKRIGECLSTGTFLAEMWSNLACNTLRMYQQE